MAWINRQDTEGTKSTKRYFRMGGGDETFYEQA